MGSVELGLGLLSIGRVWGVKNTAPPKEDAALSLIEAAYSNGVHFIDTAPAYGASEAILGRALMSPSIKRSELTIATKMGEHWDVESGTARTGHSYDELSRSLDTSLELLGQIDLLQLHKANSTNVASQDILKAFQRAETLGIKAFGASVGDLETAKRACQSGRYQVLQFPYNIDNRSLEPIFELLTLHEMKAIINRPFAMGALVDATAKKSPDELFAFILRTGFSGIILTGTSNIRHLSANLEAFRRSNA